MRVLHIVPQVPPAICGVSDYSWNIARGMRDWHGIESTMVAAGVKQSPVPEQAEFRVLRAASCGDALLKLLLAEAATHDAVVLQLSGYGFAKRGTPMSLALTLRRFARSPMARPVLTMYHELWATGPVKSSAFWLYPFCKLSIRLIAKASACVRTSRRAWGDWLAKQRGEAASQVPAFPIYSSLGEQTAFEGFAQRGEQMLLFQPLDAATVDGAAYWAAVSETEKLLQPSGLVSAGRVKGVPASVTMEQRGYVTAEQSGELMRGTAVGMLGYYDGYLAKSSLLGAYAAHGIATVMPSINHSEADGVEHGRHYVTPELLSTWAAEKPLSMRDERLERVGRELFAWYEGHSLRATVASFVGQMENAQAGTNVFRGSL